MEQHDCDESSLWNSRRAIKKLSPFLYNTFTAPLQLKSSKVGSKMVIVASAPVLQNCPIHWCTLYKWPVANHQVSQSLCVLNKENCWELEYDIAVSGLRHPRLGREGEHLYRQTIHTHTHTHFRKQFQWEKTEGRGEKKPTQLLHNFHVSCLMLLIFLLVCQPV